MASCPLNWRLFLPASWDETTTDSEEERTLIRQRRAKALIPADIGHRRKVGTSM
nr:transposase [Corynebacterium efficiens]